MTAFHHAVHQLGCLDIRRRRRDEDPSAGISNHLRGDSRSRRVSSSCHIPKQALTVTQEADAVSTPANCSGFGPLTQLSPIVSCFVPSLAIGCPFRISVHSWNPPTPSAGMKLGVQETRPFAIEAAVFIDGARVTYDVLTSRAMSSVYLQRWIIGLQSLSRITVGLRL